MEKIDKAATIVNALAEFAKDLMASIKRATDKIEDNKGVANDDVREIRKE